MYWTLKILAQNIFLVNIIFREPFKLRLQIQMIYIWFVWVSCTY